MMAMTAAVMVVAAVAEMLLPQLVAHLGPGLDRC
jgi:hypothetical protein